jgi:hypothetical protein
MYLGHVGVDSPVLGCGDRQSEGGLDGWLVPAGKAATRVSCLELRHSCVTIFTVLKKVEK